MCIVSQIGDFYKDKWKEYPYIPEARNFSVTYFSETVSKEEFDALKKEVEEMKELLKKALKYDEANNEPHCEMEEKVDFIKKIAEAVGVDLEEIFSK